MFENDVVRQPSDEVSQKKVVVVVGGENFHDKDFTHYEWVMQYVDSSKKVILITARAKGDGQLAKERPFFYGRILRLDYEDPDSQKLILLIETSMGVRKMFVSEERLVKEACGHEAFKISIE